ncbi:MAG: zinc-binding dehydrogenase [Anaerolineales bacterium]|jgi:2-desacetyl-2-hydroxyethyl bacteriochlorophyllide A dehydrogenase
MRTIYFEKEIPRIMAAKLLRPLWPGVVWSRVSPVCVDELEEPELPGERWLRVRNFQCGICATDLSLVNVEADPRVAPAAEPGIQRIYLGHEAVGEVTEVAPGVSRFKVGDRVVIEARPVGSPNCHTQEIDPPCRHCASGQSRLCENASLGRGPVGVGSGWSNTYTAHESELWPVPGSLTLDQAALIEPMAVSLHAVLRAMPEAGDKVLVIGAGNIGLLTLQALRAVAGSIHITVLARYPQQEQAARRFGADVVLAEGDLYSQLAEITAANYYQAPMNRGLLLGGFDVVYDSVGKQQTITDALRWARAGGKVVLVGSTLKPLNVDLTPVFYQEVDLIGSLTFGIESWNGRKVHTFDLVIEMLEEGLLSDAGMITHRFPFDQYRQAIHTATHKSSGAIKVMLTFGNQH